MERLFLKTVEYPVRSALIPRSFDGYRVLFFSDLHICRVGGDNRLLLRAIRESGPDCILIAGDMITEEKREGGRVRFGEALRVLRELPKIAPTYYGIGNHELRWQTREVPGRRPFADFQRKAESLGVTFLDNSSELLRRGRDAIRVTGLSLPPEKYGGRGSGVLTAREMWQLVGLPDQRHFEILLAHTPAYAESYSRWGADLTLAGHYHGGVIRLPLLGGVISTDWRLFPAYDYGRYEVGGHELIVSSGLGMHTVPVRVNNPPELVVLRLSGVR